MNANLFENQNGIYFVQDIIYDVSKYSILLFKDASDAVDELLQHTFQDKVVYNTHQISKTNHVQILFVKVAFLKEQFTHIPSDKPFSTRKINGFGQL